MTEHFHALPITPNSELYTCAGRNFLVSYGTSAKSQAAIAESIAQQIRWDNGAFSRYRKLVKWIKAQREAGVHISADEEHELLNAPQDWSGFYKWVDEKLDRPTSFAIIPDVIDGASQLQDALLKEWPFGERGMPVFHIHHNHERLLRLLDEWPRVAIGSAGEFWQVLSEPWCRRMDFLFNEVEHRHGRRTPYTHMLRGMQLVLAPHPYPFAAVDGSDAGQNHNRPQNIAADMIARWDAAQCPARWVRRELQRSLFEGVAA